MGNQNYITPDEFFKFVDGIYQFTLDVAASDSNAKCPRYFTEQENGLMQPWGTNVVWCNPPWKDASLWHRKAVSEVIHSNCPFVAILTHSCMGADWFKEIADKNASEVWILTPRIQFLSSETKKPEKANPRDQILTIYSKDRLSLYGKNTVCQYLYTPWK